MSFLSPTTHDIMMIANSEKLKSDKDKNEKNEELDDFLKDDSSYHLDSPKSQIQFMNNDNKNDDIDQILKHETESLNGPPPEVNNTINVSAPGEDDVFTPPEELDEYQKASEKDKKQMKYFLLRKLGDLATDRKLILFRDYTINDDYYDIKREYDYQTGEIAKRRFANNVTQVTLNVIGILEFFSKRYNIFDINLSGWKENVELRKEELICIIKELYDKYHTAGKQSPPEVKLLVLLVTTAFSTAMSNYKSKYMGSLFGGQRNMNDIEIDATRQAMIERGIQEQNLEQGNSINRTDQDIFSQIQDEATIEVKKHLQQKQLQTQKIYKGNTDIQQKFQNEVVNRGLQDVYNKQGQNEQTDMEGPDMSDIPEIVSITVNDQSKLKTKPQFKSKKSKKN